MLDLDNMVAWRLLNQQMEKEKLRKAQESEDAGRMLDYQKFQSSREDAERNHEREDARFRFEQEQARELAKQRAADEFSRLAYTQTQIDRRAREKSAADHQNEVDKRSFETDSRLMTEANARDIERMREAAALERAKILASAQRDRFDLTFGDRTTREQDMRLEHLNKTMKELPDVGILQTLAKASLEKDVPGVGRFDAPLTNWGLKGGENITVRQATGQLHSALLKLWSGGAVTPSEAERAAINTGMSSGATEEQWRAGVKAMLANIRRAAKNAETTVHPEDIVVRKSRGGTTSMDFPLIEDEPFGGIE